MREYRLQILNNKIVNRNSFLEYLVNNIEDGFYNVFVEKTRVGQSKYFFYRDIIAEYLGYGTRKEKDELHDFLKKELLLGIFKDPENLNTEDYENLTLSTKWLTEKGWFNFLRSLELYAASKFDIILN